MVIWKSSENFSNVVQWSMLLPKREIQHYISLLLVSCNYYYFYFLHRFYINELSQKKIHVFTCLAIFKFHSLFSWKKKYKWNKHKCVLIEKYFFIFVTKHFIFFSKKKMIYCSYIVRISSVIYVGWKFREIEINISLQLDKRRWYNCWYNEVLLWMHSHKMGSHRYIWPLRKIMIP